MDVLQWSRHYRCFPGQGALDVAGFARRVLAAGYAGPLSLEIFNDVFRQADPAAWPSTGCARCSCWRTSSSRSCPTAPRSPASRSSRSASTRARREDTERLLRAMGFAATGPHRSKPVHLWEHGDIRVVLNHGVGDDDPEVVAVAVESADPRRSAARAEALLAPVLERHRNPGDADLAAVAAPDGTSLFFCGAGPDGGWLDDFLAVEAGAENGEPPVPIDRIDHITLAQPFEAFDEAALFYRSVLGMRPRQSVEVAAPDGLVRSRAMTGAGGRVRIVLNVPALAGAQGGQAELQHVAFHCDDALAAARAMHDRGVPILRIPDNYYDDLAARFDLDGGLLDAMRTLGVLYDRSPEGELLHFYTARIEGRVFFEVLERRGTYDGYGAVNSPVRMTAQRAARAPVA